MKQRIVYAKDVVKATSKSPWIHLSVERIATYCDMPEQVFDFDMSYYFDKDNSKIYYSPDSLRQDMYSCDSVCSVNLMDLNLVKYKDKNNFILLTGNYLGDEMYYYNTLLPRCFAFSSPHDITAVVDTIVKNDTLRRFQSDVVNWQYNKESDAHDIRLEFTVLHG